MDNIRILYVDDEPALLDIARAFLEKSEEVRVVTAVSAQEALTDPALGSYDAIVSDYQMPGMDGIAFLKEVRGRFRDLPFILFTGRGREEVVIEAINNGADFYLQKGGDPVAQFAELAHKVRQAVARKRAERSLSTSEERLQSFMDSATDAFTIWDAGLRLVDLNRSALSYLPAGTRREDVLGKSLESLLPGVKESGLYDRYLGVLGTGIPFIGSEVLPETPYGRLCLSIKAFRVGDGLGIITTDTTRQKAAEEELRGAYEQLTASEEELRGQYEELALSERRIRESEARFRAISTELEMMFKNMINAFGIFESVFDKNGKYVSFRFGRFNDAYARISGLSYDDVKGKDVFEVWPATEKEWVEAYGSVAVTGVPKVFDMYHGPTKGWYHCNAYRPTDSPDHICVIFENITERRQMEEALQQAKLVVENSPAVLFRWKAEEGWPVVYVSNNVTRFRYTPEELLSGRIPFAAIVHPDDLARVAEEVRRYSLEGTDQYRQEYRIIAPDGKVFWVDDRTIIERDQGGKITHYQGVLIDITEQKLAQTLARETGRKYQNVIENSPYGIHFFHLNPGGHLVFTGANPAADRILKISHSPLIGKTIEEAFPGLTGTEIPGRYRDVAATGTVWQTEQVTYDQGAVSGAFTVIAFQTAPGSMAAMFADITERMRAENLLRESENRTRKILEREPLPLAFVNNAGVITFRNEHFIRVFGYSADEVPNLEAWWQRAYPDPGYRSQAIRQWEEAVRQAAAEQADIRPAEYRVTCKNGEERIIEISGIILNDGFLATFIDHTEQKRIEEALKRRLVALTQPLPDTVIAFEDLFDIDEVQRLQDDFANATGTGALLTRPDGTPITKPSNFCRLCGEIVRQTPAGRDRCYRSDSILGSLHEGNEPFIHTCLSAGLWGAGTNIVVGGQHIANWLIGQVRNETQTEEGMRTYAREIGADEEEFIRAFHEVPVMSYERFASAAKALHTLANQLSVTAYQNVQQARFITERRQMEDALREKTKELDQFFTASLDLFCIADTSGYFRRLNPEWERTLGYTLSELEGKRFLDFVHPDDIPGTLAAIADLASQKQVLNFTNRYRHRDGSYRWIEWRSLPSGELILAAARDITERRQMEEALRESEARLSSILHGSPVLQFVIDAGHRILSWNRALEEYSGVAAENVIGTDQQWRAFYAEKRPVLADLLVDNNTDGLYKWYAGKLRKSRYVEGAYEATDFFPAMGPSGTWLSFTAAPIRDAGGKIIGAVETLEDVTERRRMEEALRESEARFRGIVEQSTDIFYRQNIRTGAFEYFSPRVLDILGYTPEEMIAMSADEQKAGIHPDDLPSLRSFPDDLVAADARGERMLVREFRIRKKDDGYCWVHGNYTLVRDRDGRPASVIGCLHDITKRRLAEAALAESEERLQLFIRHAPAALAMFDREMRYLAVSRRWMTDYHLGDVPVIGRSHYEIFPELPEDLKAIHRRCLAGETLSASEDRFTRKDGSVQYLAWEVIPWYTAGNAIGGIIIFSEDITARRQAEKALRESGEEYRRILDNLQDGYIRTDENGTVTMVNPSAVRMYRYGSVDEMIGIPAASLYHRPEQRKELLRILKDAGGVTDFNGEALRKDGTFFEASLNVQFIRDENGTIRGTEGLVRDITERRSMEHTIKEANRKLNLLNSITRHDIKNQLTALQGFVGIAALKEQDPVVAGYLAKIDKGSDTIRRQIEFMRSYQELGIQSPGWFRLDETVAKARRKEVVFSRTCGGIAIFADPMLENVFSNLFDNAMRHGEHATEIHVRCEQSPEGLVIIVEDNGTGIPPDEKEKIFKKGFGKNTGLGLFLAKEILSITGITIRECGTYGKGARFEILVPKEKYRTR